MVGSPENKTIAKNESERRASPTKYVIKFLLVWLLALPVIAATALLSDINWTKPYVQKYLGELLHRDVRVGKLTWHLALNGVEVETSEIEILEVTGEHFVTTKHCNIGVAVLPLASGRLVLKHIDVKSPNVWAIKVAPDKWNFDDLLIEGPEIRLIDLRDGTINIVDETKGDTRDNPFSFSDLRMTLNWPRKNKRLPFYLSMARQHDKFKTTINLEGYGEGKWQTWLTNKYSFKLKGDNIYPTDLNTLLEIIEAEDSEEKLKNQFNLAEVDGLINIEVEGEGVLEEGLTTSVNGEVKGLAVNNSTIGDINAGDATGSLNMTVSHKDLSWDSLKLQMRGMTIQSSGKLTEWQDNDSKVDAKINGVVHNIKDVDYIFGKFAIPKEKFGKNIITQFNPTKISGKATLSINLKGTTNDAKILTKIDTEKIVFGDVIKDAHSQLPLLYVFGVTPETKISGNIRVAEQEKIELVKGTVSSPTAKILADGFLNLKKGIGKLSLHAKKISLKETGLNVKQHRKKLTTHPGYLEIGKNYEIALNGHADADSIININGPNVNLAGNFKLINASMSLPKGILNLSNVNGKCDFKFNHLGYGRLNLPKITGNIGEGKFELSGQIISKREHFADLSLHATHFDLKHLSGLMRLFQVDLPILTEEHLYGSVKDVRISLSGTPKEPEIFLSAIPDNLYYKPPGLEKPLRATAGQIIYDNDELDLKDVEIVSRGNTIVTSISIENLSTEARIKRVKAKTEGIDLADIHYYLSSPVMPPPLQIAYKEVLQEYKISNPRGKAYGDILCLLNEKGEVTFDGLIGCFKVGVDFYKYPINNLAGILAASGDDLLMRDLHGTIRDSRFSLDGFIKNYRTKNPNWKAEITAKLHPREIVQAVPRIQEKLQSGTLKIHSRGPLTLRSKLQGNFKKNDIQFSVSADKKDRLRVETQYGNFYQPQGQPLTLDGGVKIRDRNITVDNTHLVLGDTLVAMKGNVTLKPKKQKPKSKKFEKNEVDSINLNIEFPQEASLSTLVGLTNPDMAKEISGELKGSIRAQGKIPTPNLSGKIEFAKVKLPSLSIKRLDGHIRGEQLKIKGKETTSCKLVVYDTEIQNIVLRNLSADIYLIPHTNTDSMGKVMMRNGHATIAGGTIRLNGWTDLQNRDHFIEAKINDVSARKLSKKLLGDANELTGDMNVDIKLRSKGLSNDALLKNLHGKGIVQIHDGVVGRFGTLQTRLTQYNLLTQGIFGFNMNNLLQSVWPVRTGEFKTLTNEFTITKGNLTIDNLRYTGDDMRLWGTGYANMPKNKLSMEIAGKIPRVTKSMLGGTVGSVSRKMTLQRAMNVITFGKLEYLPSLPLIGSIASDKPRTFTFRIAAPLDNPDVVAKSIMKTFKWLPNKPQATAHPVPGIK